MTASIVTFAVAHRATDPTAVIVIAVVVGVVVTLGYLVACVIWPFANCLRCGGTGKRRSPSGKAWRKCRRCKGTGARLRTGRRIFNYLSQTKRDAS